MQCGIPQYSNATGSSRFWNHISHKSGREPASRYLPVLKIFVETWRHDCQDSHCRKISVYPFGMINGMRFNKKNKRTIRINLSIRIFSLEK